MEEEELAKEELKMLEAQYPNQYEYLKIELRAFIFQLQSNHHDSSLIPENNYCNNFLDTEESTCLEQMKRSNINNYRLGVGLTDREIMEGMIDKGWELESPKSAEVKDYRSRKNNNKRRDRVDLVLERAQACLKKIRHLKTSLLSHS